MKKPNAAAIRAAEPLVVAAVRRLHDRMLACNICGGIVDPSDLPLTVWREHDEYDKPIDGVDGLLFVGSGRDHAACRKLLDEHPRLYAEETAKPGYFPELCGACIHRDGLQCRHADLKANGGEGLGVHLEAFAGFICSRGRRCYVPVRHAHKCAGRRTLRLVEGGGA